MEFSSAMAVDGVEPQFTTWTANFHGCIDYILYEPARYNSGSASPALSRGVA
jgi:mRNA deadenylase 3'-5' endonuclease subunit Ccr4